MDNLEQELLARQEKEFDQQQQQERLARAQQQEEQNQGGLVNAAANLGKKYAKDAVKEEVVAAASGILTSTAPIWGPILAGIVGIFALIIIIIAVAGAACNQGGLKGQ